MTRTRPAEFRNPHGRRNKAARALWTCAYRLLFRPSPWFMSGWRTWVLRRFGARLGRDVRLKASAQVWAPWLLEAGDEVYVDDRVNLYNPFGIRIGSRVVVSQGAFLCSASHDHRDPRYRLVGGRITVGDDCWVAAEAFVGPGVTVGPGAVVAARATVVKDVPAWSVVAGNPARVVNTRTLETGGDELNAAAATAAPAALVPSPGTPGEGEGYFGMPSGAEAFAEPSPRPSPGVPGEGARRGRAMRD